MEEAADLGKIVLAVSRDSGAAVLLAATVIKCQAQTPVIVFQTDLMLGRLVDATDRMLNVFSSGFALCKDLQHTSSRRGRKVDVREIKIILLFFENTRKNKNMLRGLILNPLKV